MGSMGRSSYQIEELRVLIENNLFIYSAQTNTITQGNVLSGTWNIGYIFIF